MSKLLAAILIMGLVSFSIALADDMDSDRVVREEHVTRAADSADQPAADQTSDHASARPHHDHPNDSDSMDLENLGLYFGLGERFIDNANMLINERYARYYGYQSFRDFSSLSDISSSGTDETAYYDHDHSTNDDESGGIEDHNINRRGADHDYFYD